MRKYSAMIMCAIIAVATPAIADAAPASAAAPAAPAVLSTADTTIGTLLANPATKAILDKRIPGLSDNPSIAMAEGMTLRAIQPMAGDKITEAMLDAVDADLKALKPGSK